MKNLPGDKVTYCVLTLTCNERHQSKSTSKNAPFLPKIYQLHPQLLRHPEKELSLDFVSYLYKLGELTYLFLFTESYINLNFECFLFDIFHIITILFKYHCAIA